MKLILACGFLCLFASFSGRAADSASLVSTNSSASVKSNQVEQVPGDHYTNSIGMELVKVGNFWAGKYEVTQKEFQKVLGGNPSAFSGDTLPVDSVNYEEALNFCAKLTAQQLAETTNRLPAGYYYTLPTEDEWQALVGDASLNDSVTSMGTRRNSTSPVGSLKPNSLGLYDTRGNVMEFCLADPSQTYRVLHGGSWADFLEVNLRPAFRYSTTPTEKKNTFGFRVLLKKQ